MTKHVTIVEDDPDVRALLARSLSAEGYQVTALESGVGIEDVITSNHIDLVILDIGLPVMDGYELARLIRARPGENPHLVAVTGYGLESDRARSSDAGFEAHVVKPFQPDRVLDSIKKLIG